MKNYPLLLKGFGMGTADVVPGVSGGTVAFITGIYQELLYSLSLFNKEFFRLLLNFEFRQALNHLNLAFLIPLGSGIMLAMISTAKLMHYLLTNHPILIWAFFLGLIVASVYIVGKQIENIKSLENGILIFMGAIFAYGIVSLVPVETPNTWWFLMLTGMIGISAMILPGISGSFLMLILGKYPLLIEALKNPFALESLQVLILFASGAFLGLISFCRLLTFFYNRFQNQTVCLLTGFMIGALKKVWPWKETLETVQLKGKTYILREQNILPVLSDINTAIALLLMLIGFVLIILIEKQSTAKLGQPPTIARD